MSSNNARIAEIFERTADLLEAQRANPHRIRAYRDGAESLRALPRDIGEMRSDELLEVPHIGHGLAAAVREVLGTGRYRLLERVSGEVCPEALFATVPGIGAELAHRIVETLHCETLEELEMAAHQGRLARVEGFGARRVQLVRAQLAEMLARHRRPYAPPPPVRVLLDVDRIYRERAASGSLAHIAPRRFNPGQRAWLPILHLERDGWAFTAMYSNTARAHRLGRTRDWVVICFERDGRDGQCTVVTEHHGVDAGRRVVRGREIECAAHHRNHPPVSTIQARTNSLRVRTLLDSLAHPIHGGC